MENPTWTSTQKLKSKDPLPSSSQVGESLGFLEISWGGWGSGCSVPGVVVLRLCLLFFPSITLGHDSKWLNMIRCRLEKGKNGATCRSQGAIEKASETLRQNEPPVSPRTQIEVKVLVGLWFLLFLQSLPSCRMVCLGKKGCSCMLSNRICRNCVLKLPSPQSFVSRSNQEGIKRTMFRHFPLKATPHPIQKNRKAGQNKTSKDQG